MYNALLPLLAERLVAYREAGRLARRRSLMTAAQVRTFRQRSLTHVFGAQVTAGRCLHRGAGAAGEGGQGDSDEQADGYRFGVAVEAIVRSPQFRQVRVVDAEEKAGGN